MALTSKTIAGSYHSLLKVGTSDQQNFTTSLLNIVDGEDTASCLSLTKNTGALAALSVDGDNAAGTQIQIDNSAGDGDVSLAFQLSGTTTWLMGIEDGDSDSLKICHSNTMGTDERLSLLTASTVVNEDSADIDFRVEGAGDANLLFCDAGNDRVGIGTASADSTLHMTKTGGDCILTIESTGNNNYSGILFERESSSGVSKGAAYIRAESDTSTTAGLLEFGVAYNLDADTAATKMVIDHDGKVGIGTAAPDGLLHIVSSAEGGFTDGSTAVPQLVVEGTGTTAGSTSPFVVLHNSSTAVDNDFIGKIAFTGDDGTGDATGDLSAGTEYASIFCRILDETDNSTDGQLYLSTDVDDAKVDTVIISGGNVGIGTTPTTSKLIVRNNDDVLSATANVLHVMDNHATVDAGDVLVRLDFAADADVDGDEAKFISFHDSDGEIGYIAAASASTMQTAITNSDVRLKTDIKDSSLEGLNIINALKIRDFKWNDKAKKNAVGIQEINQWVADEVYEVYPKAVMGKPGRMMPVKDEYGNKTGEEEMYPIGLAYTEFIAPMMKAIQELSASNDALKARIEVLEG